MKIYEFLIGFFVGILVISNVVTIKVFQIKLGDLELVFDGGALIFPISYVLADIFTEVYGYKKARKIIWIGFFVLIIFNVILYLTIILPPEPNWNSSIGQENFEKVLGISPRIALAGIIGYFWGEFTNSFILAKMKINTKGKYLWQRVIFSTLLGQLVDTIIFCTIAFGGILDTKTLINYIVTGYFYKVTIEVLLSPLTVKTINQIKKIENVDHYDYNTNFNPFWIGD
ncbi:MAG: queuosine precursor transporter [Candidatus Calescibacterium sp.]|nr:queuosine precursor transporter [Candidatus Calescibacterium sp.]MCX7971645.1 queuosine precursor transporter [bacterium]MDW8195853.1 queuosine precursor transporter [Candidatus Calescibacterium sp.]